MLSVLPQTLPEQPYEHLRMSHPTRDQLCIDYLDNNQMIKEALIASHLARAKEAEQMAEKTRIKLERENWLTIAQCFRRLADLAR